MRTIMLMWVGILAGFVGGCLWRGPQPRRSVRWVGWKPRGSASFERTAALARLHDLGELDTYRESAPEVSAEQAAYRRPFMVEAELATYTERAHKVSGINNLTFG